MNTDHDTGPGPKLPLAERAKRGLLALEPELSITELSELECPSPADSAARKAFHAALCVECDFGSLTAQKKPYLDYQAPLGIQTSGPRDPEFHRNLAAFSDSPRRSNAPTDWGTPLVWVVSRESYRAWRLACPPDLLSPLSQIHKWLGATPAVSLPDEPTANRVLLALLDEVDKRAAEQGAGFDRHSLPGTKEEFHVLAKAYNRPVFTRAHSTFSDYLKGHCRFQSGVKPEHGKGAAIWALFPEYSLKTG